MEPKCRTERPTPMLADTSDLHALSAAQRHHADDLTAVAARLAAAQLAPDAFGSVGAGFLTALNQALTAAARHAEHLAERLVTATATTRTAADAYAATELRSGQAISTLGA